MVRYKDIDWVHAKGKSTHDSNSLTIHGAISIQRISITINKLNCIICFNLHNALDLMIGPDLRWVYSVENLRQDKQERG